MGIIIKNGNKFTSGGLSKKQHSMLTAIYNKIFGEESDSENTEQSSQLVYVGNISTTGGTVDVAALYPDTYMNYTTDNFFFKNITGYVQSEGSNYGNSGSAQMSFTHQWSYDASTGILTFSGTYMNFNEYSWRGTGWLKADVYLLM